MKMPQYGDYNNGMSYANAMIPYAFDGYRYSDREERQRKALVQYEKNWNDWNERRIYGDLDRSGEYRRLASRASSGLITSQEVALYNRLRDITKRWKSGGRLTDEEIKLLRSYVGTADNIGNVTYYTYD